MQIITPVFRLNKTESAQCRSGSIIHTSFSFMSQTFGAFNTAKGKICFMTGKASSVRRDSLRDLQRKVQNKSSPHSSVIVLHVMSTWRAQCLPWQSRMTNPVRHSGPKYLGNTLNIDPLTVRPFPETKLLWSECWVLNCKGSKAFQKSEFLLPFEVCIPNKMHQGSPVLT